MANDDVHPDQQREVVEVARFPGSTLNRPSSEQPAEVLEDLVIEIFRDRLLLVEGEELSMDTNYFDLGLTSLRLIEIKQRLEDNLGIALDATVLFNRSTVDDLIDYLNGLPPAAADVSAA
jgi:acyl carrier protein